MTAPDTFEEIDGYESFEELELADEAARARKYRPNPVYAPGGLSSATLHTPKGAATLNFPTAVPTLAQYRSLERAVNASSARLTSALADLARVRRELAIRRRDSGAGGMSMLLPLLLNKQLKDDLAGHKHGDGPLPTFPAGGGGAFSSFLPLLLLQPNLFGGGGNASSTGSEGMPSFMNLFIMMEIFDRGV